MDQTKYFISESYKKPQYANNELQMMPQYKAVNAMLGLGVGRQ